MERCSDVILHSGPVTSLSIAARRLARIVWLPFASPQYLTRFEAPKNLEDLRGHNCLIHQTVSPRGRWAFSNEQGEVSVSVKGSFSSNSVLMLREAAERGVGVALLPTFCVDEALAAGALVRLLPAYQGQDRDLYVAYELTRALPKRTRLFIDHLTQRLKTPRWAKAIDDAWPKPLSIP